MIAVAVVTVVGVGLGVGLGLSAQGDSGPPASLPTTLSASDIVIAGAAAASRRLTAGLVRTSDRALAQGSVAAETVAIANGASFVGGMNMQTAIDSAMALDLWTALVGKRWAVKNHGLVDPQWDKTDIIEFTVAGSLTSVNGSVAAFGMCSKKGVSPGAITAGATVENLGQRLLLGMSTLECAGGAEECGYNYPSDQTETGALSAPAAAPEHCPPPEGCSLRSVISVVSAFADEIVLKRDSPDCKWTGGNCNSCDYCGCGKISVLSLLE